MQDLKVKLSGCKVAQKRMCSWDIYLICYSFQYTSLCLVIPFRKACHMLFHRLIPHYNLTGSKLLNYALASQYEMLIYCIF